MSDYYADAFESRLEMARDCLLVHPMLCASAGSAAGSDGWQRTDALS